MKLNLHPKGIPKQEPLGADTPLKKGGVVVGMRKEGDKEKIYFVGDDCHLLCVGATRSGICRWLLTESSNRNSTSRCCPTRALIRVAANMRTPLAV